jgi:TPR repeat protein
MSNLGTLLVYGHEEGFVAQPARGIEWLEKAVERGDATAMRELGIIFFKGELVEKNQDRGIDLLQTAARLSDGDAQKILGGLGRSW